MIRGKQYNKNMDNNINGFSDEQELDYLTNLPNRYSYEKAMKEILNRARIRKTGYVLLI